MDDLSGPHYDPDLIGPDGRLMRLHKGGQHKANALAQEQLRQQEAHQRQQRRQARRTMRQERRTAKRDRQQARRLANRVTEDVDEAVEDNIEPTAPPPATQYISDVGGPGASASGGGSAFGLSRTKRPRFGLGGTTGSLG